MPNKDDAFINAMRLAAHNNPEFFTLKDGDYYFLDWRFTGWMASSMSDLLLELFPPDAVLAEQEEAA